MASNSIRAPTRDLSSGLAAAAAAHPVHTVEQLGPNRHLLKNGSLLCTNVPIARVGWLIYGPGEVPVQPGDMGVSYVERTADALFNPITMGSFASAAVTNDHPPDDVDPSNWSRYSGGYTLNVRRGTGDDADVLLADLMITRKDLIDDILAGKVEVSAGYDADYQDRGGGAGKQHNIIGNHIALVKNGRCGPRCAIGDAAYQTNPENQPEHEPTMATQTRIPTRRRATIDAAALEALRVRAQEAVRDLEAAEGEDDDAVHVHIHNNADGAPARTTDAATHDRITLLEEGQETLLALVTGIAESLKAGRTTDGKGSEEDEYDSSKTYDAEDDSEPAKAWRAKKTKDAAAAAGTEEGDSKALSTSYTDLVAKAEVLVPGFKVPTFDAAFTRAKTVDRMCAARRRCLDQFATTDSGAAMLKGLNGGTEIDVVSIDCAAAKTIFDAAAVAQGVLNNTRANAGGGAAPTRTGDAARGIAAGSEAKVPSIAEINKQAAEFWKGK